MKTHLYDFRSDTVTRPTPEMRRAMYEAEVGDDVFGDDPSVIRLQEMVAEIVGKEKSLYVPSGTMANQIAVHCHTRPGDEVYCEAGCHVLNYEGGAAALLSGVSLYPISGVRGAYSADDVEPRLRSGDHHNPVSRLIWVENSGNRSGGTIFPQDKILGLRRLADARHLTMHLDGARIWNVSAATEIPVKELAAPFETVSCCLSKGLGCPVGSLISGSAEFIDHAHRARKRFGGGMRQAGVLAAAGIYALQHHRERLTKDHERARRLALAIAELKSFEIDILGVQTNIVIFDVESSGWTGIEVVRELRSEGVLATAFGSKVRMVVHLDIDDDAIEAAIRTLRKLYH